MKNLRKKAEGFTIIEVMIVLVIAAVILLIVFLAVPALQRNSRNTQRKTDVAAILAGVNEFSSNNAGAQPNGTWTGGTTLTIVGASGTSSTQANLGYYTGTTIGPANGQVNKVPNGTATEADTLNSGTEDYVIVSTGTQCSNNASVVGSSRSTSVVYLIENGSNSYTQQCQSS